MDPHRFELLIQSIDNINKRLDTIEKRLSSLTDLNVELHNLSATNQIIITTVQSHGGHIGKLEQLISRLRLRCPFNVVSAPAECRNLEENEELKAD